MKTLLVLLVMTAPAFALGQEPRQPAESPQAFRCRVEHTPAVRECVQKCESSYAKPAFADQRWECVQLCTVRGLWAMAECRRQKEPSRQAQMSLAESTALQGSGAQASR